MGLLLTYFSLFDLSRVCKKQICEWAADGWMIVSRGSKA
jgi:hypothetical protein